MPEPTDPAAPADPAPQPPADPAPADPPGPNEPVDWEAEAKKWQNLSRKNEDRAKTNAAAAKKLADLEEADKTEAEKLAERLTAAEQRATNATQLAVAQSVKASATGRFADPQDAVDALGHDFLTDDGQIDGEAIETALAGLLERKPHWKADSGPRTPRPDPSQGPRPGGTVNVDAQIAEAQSKSDWKTVLRLQNSKLATVPRPK